MKTRALDGTWVVRAGGAVIGESENAIEFSEADRPDRVYFPREDIAMAFLEPTGTTQSYPGKGEAIHYSIITKSMTITETAWSYENPEEALADVAGYIAFAPGDLVTVEKV